MAVQLIDGAVVMSGGAVATDAACCCGGCDCETLDFDFVIGDGGWPDATYCTPCADTELSQGNTGPAYWEWTMNTDTGCSIDVYTYDGAYGECQVCSSEEFNPVNLVNRGSFGFGSPLLITRAEPITECQENIHFCFWLQPQGLTRLACCFDNASTQDTNTCESCCSIEIVANVGMCFPFDGDTGGVAAASASFTITIPDLGFEPNCDSIFGDGSDVEWNLYIGGILVETGTGLTGSGSGDMSCTCPTEDPCEVAAIVLVEWCLGGVCCSSSVIV